MMFAEFSSEVHHFVRSSFRTSWRLLDRKKQELSTLLKGSQQNKKIRIYDELYETNSNYIASGT